LHIEPDFMIILIKEQNVQGMKNKIN
jgi:hypothetical protein